MVAAIRADSVNIALFVHVLGAMLLVGSLIVVASALIAAWRRTDPAEAAALARVGLRAVLIGVFPSYVVMRIGAQWTESEQNLPKAVEDSQWLGIGYITADAGGLLIVISIALAVLGLRGLRREGGGTTLTQIVGAVSVLLIVAYLVAVWAMTAKPD